MSATRDRELQACQVIGACLADRWPATRALRLAAATCDDAALEQRLARAAASTEQGADLASALGGLRLSPAHAGAAQEIARTEQAGAVMAALASGPLARRRLTRRLQGLLIYPAALLLAILVGTVAMAWLVLPQLELWRRSAGIEPALNPWGDALLALFSPYGAAGLLLCGALASLLWRRCGLVWRARLLGPLVLSSQAGIARSLAALLEAGVGLPEALETTADAIDGDRTIRRSLRQASNGVRQGFRLSEQLVTRGLLPGYCAGPVRAGESHSSLPHALHGVARVLEAEVDGSFGVFAAKLSSALMLAAGLLVAWLGVITMGTVY